MNTTILKDDCLIELPFNQRWTPPNRAKYKYIDLRADAEPYIRLKVTEGYYGWSNTFSSRMVVL